MRQLPPSCACHATCSSEINDSRYSEIMNALKIANIHCVAESQ